MLAEPNCSIRTCMHFIGVDQPDETEMTETNACPAFPNGIPDEIAYGNNRHLRVSPGQTGTAIYEKGRP